AEPARAALVYRPLSLPRDAALRHPLGLPGVLRPRRILRLPLDELRAHRSRRPAVRGRRHVDLRDLRVSRRRNDREHAAPRLADPSRTAGGDRVAMATEGAGWRMPPLQVQSTRDDATAPAAPP